MWCSVTLRLYPLRTFIESSWSGLVSLQLVETIAKPYQVRELSNQEPHPLLRSVMFSSLLIQALQLFTGWGAFTVRWYVLIYGANLTKMATAMNHELDSLRKRKSAIIDSVANQATPRWLSVKLQEEGMISAENASAIVNSSSLSNEDKVNRLIQAVESKLRHGSAPAQHFQEFVEILQSEPALKDLAQKLQTGKCTAQSPCFFHCGKWFSLPQYTALDVPRWHPCFKAYRS